MIANATGMVNSGCPLFGSACPGGVVHGLTEGGRILIHFAPEAEHDSKGADDHLAGRETGENANGDPPVKPGKIKYGLDGFPKID